jgi:hypothetical protein
LARPASHSVATAAVAVLRCSTRLVALQVIRCVAHGIFLPVESVRRTDDRERMNAADLSRRVRLSPRFELDLDRRRSARPEDAAPPGPAVASKKDSHRHASDGEVRYRPISTRLSGLWRAGHGRGEDAVRYAAAIPANNHGAHVRHVVCPNDSVPPGGAQSPSAALPRVSSERDHQEVGAGSEVRARLSAGAPRPSCSVASPPLPANSRNRRFPCRFRMDPRRSGSSRKALAPGPPEGPFTPSARTR